MASASITLAGLWLHDVLDPAGTALKLPNRARSTNYQLELGYHRYAGRTRPVARFGQNDDFTAQFGALLRDDGTQKASLEVLLRRKATLCVRDNAGRKVFGTIGALPMQDLTWGGTEVNLTVTETAYSEEV